MKIHWILLPFLAQGALAQLFKKEPESTYVARQGQAVTLECETRESSICAWKLVTPGLRLTGFILSRIPTNVDITARNPDSETDCTITLNNIDTRYDGQYTCSPFMSGGAQEDANPAEVIIARKPAQIEFTGDWAGRTELQASAAEPTAVTCEATGARPQAELAWYLDNTQIYEGIEEEYIPEEDSKLMTSRSQLTHQFDRADNGARLRCLANHPGYDEEETSHEVALTVDVQYAPYRPEGNSIGKIYGFTAEQTGVVTVNFTSNPAPQQMSWKIGEATAVSVGGQSLDGRFTASQLETMDAAQGSYSLSLTIEPVMLEDQEKTFELRLRNAVGETRLDFSIGTGPPPPPAVIGTGTIAGIVVGVLLLLIIIGLLAFGRSQGKWCFAGKERPPQPKQPPRSRPRSRSQVSLSGAAAPAPARVGGGGKPGGGIFKMPTSYKALKQSLSARPNRRRLADVEADDVEGQGDRREVTYTNQPQPGSEPEACEPPPDVSQVYSNEPPPARRPLEASALSDGSVPTEPAVPPQSSDVPAPNMATLPQTPLSPVTPVEFPTVQSPYGQGDLPAPLPGHGPTNPPWPQKLPPPGLDGATNAHAMPLGMAEPGQRAPLPPPHGPQRYSHHFPRPAADLPPAGSREELGIPYQPATAAPPLPPKARPLSQVPPGAVQLFPGRVQSEIASRFPSSPSLSEPQILSTQVSQV